MNIQPQTIDFEEIRQEIISYLITKEGFTDIDFEGSNISILVDILASVTAKLHYNLNMSVNELFLDSSQIRKNVVAIAKSLSYYPKRPVSSKATIELELKAEEIPEGVGEGYEVTLPKDTIFRAGGYEFRTITEVKLLWTGGLVKRQIPLYQLRKDTTLEIHTLFDQTQHLDIKIYSLDIENDLGLIVAIDGTVWTPDIDENITEIQGDDEIYFINEFERGLQIRFGDSILGLRPDDGQTLDIDLYLTDGAVANNLSDFVMEGPEVGDIIDNDLPQNTFTSSQFAVTLVDKSQGGANIESIDSIKVNAPRFYVSQNRAVTLYDYLVLLERGSFQFSPNSITVWGGDQNFPRNLGKVYMSFTKQSGIEQLLSDDEKQEIITYIKQFSIVTLQHEVVDPEFIYITVTSVVKAYNDANTQQVKSDATVAVVDYLKSVSSFNSSFKQSAITTDIDQINGVSSNSYEYNMYFRLRGEGSRLYQKRLVKNVLPESMSGSFVIGPQNYLLEDDGNGKMLLNDDVIGTINYVEGFMTIELPIALDTDNNIDIYFEVSTVDFDIERNLVLVGLTPSVNVIKLEVTE